MPKPVSIKEKVRVFFYPMLSDLRKSSAFGMFPGFALLFFWEEQTKMIVDRWWNGGKGEGEELVPVLLRPSQISHKQTRN